MAIKTIEYNVNIAGITPATEQFGGTQGDHRVTKLNFVFSDKFHQEIDELQAEGDKVMYRFDVYDGEGGIWSSDCSELLESSVGIELEERHTRFGGKIAVYLVITLLSMENETQVELYSFPAILRLKNRPEGEYQAGENYESVSSLAETTKQKAVEATISAMAAEKSKKELQNIATEIEEKLKNGDFDGVGIKSARIVNDELIIAYTDGTSQNLGNVKGEIGMQGIPGEKGDKGDMPDMSNYYTKDECKSTFAQFDSRIQDAEHHGIAAQVALDNYKNEVGELPAVKNTYENDNYFSINSPNQNQYIDLYDNADLDINADGHNININAAKIRNLGNPEIDTDAANKGYVDGLVGDIDNALDELHDYARAIIGGAE